MNPEELAKEIDRRKQTEKDLKLRELIWKLYGSHLEYYSKNVQKEPGAILPALKDSLSIKDNRYSFSVNGTQYEIVHEQGKEEKQGRWDDETVTTPMRLSLERGCKLVFIDGAWVQEITAFVQELEEYRREYWAKRNSEKQAQKALSERKRFGL